jgi:hypothetical protein
MKAATIDDIKKELQQLPPKKLIDICLRLGRSKKENKELLTYLLFESQDEAGYVQSIINEMDELFVDLPKATVYLTKKAMRKIIRLINKHSKYMGSKTATVELILHFCIRCKEHGLNKPRYPVLNKIFLQQLKKAETLLPAIEEDLQYDFKKQLVSLSALA